MHCTATFEFFGRIIEISLHTNIQIFMLEREDGRLGGPKVEEESVEFPVCF